MLDGGDHRLRRTEHHHHLVGRQAEALLGQAAPEQPRADEADIPPALAQFLDHDRRIGDEDPRLHLLAGVLRPDSGSIAIDGRALDQQAPGRELARLVGVMHQQYDLVPNLAVIHNVLAGRLGEWGLLRSLVSLVTPRERERASLALERVGIGEKLYERTSRLSGGEQQRVALARLLVQDPKAILADEPVSSVDPARTEALIGLLVGIAAESGRTLVASLHSVPLALDYFDRIIALRDGGVLFDRPAPAVHAADLDALYALRALPASVGR